MTPRTHRVRVADLEKRSEAEFNIQPGTNEEIALRFLASNPEWAYPPTAIAAETQVPPASATKTMTRLRDKGAVEVSDGYYFVPEEQLEAVRGFLGDLHHINQMPAGDDYEAVHPTHTDADTTIGDEDGSDVADPDDEQSPTVDDYDPVPGSDTDDEADTLLDSADGTD